MEKKVIRAALLGLGTVGTGVYKVIKNQKEEMIPKLGSEIEISKILVRNLEKAAAKVDDPKILTNNWDDIVNDPEIDVVIELRHRAGKNLHFISSECRKTRSFREQRPDRCSR